MGTPSSGSSLAKRTPRFIVAFDCEVSAERIEEADSVPFELSEVLVTGTADFDDDGLGVMDGMANVLAGDELSDGNFEDLV